MSKEEKENKELKNKKEVKKTTVWLDALVCILLPVITLIGTVRIIRTLLNGNLRGMGIVFLLLEIIFTLLHAYTMYHAYNRHKEGYMLLRILIILTAIRSSINFAVMQNANSDINVFLVFFGYFAVCCVAWIYPHEIYFKARKHLFKRESTFSVIKKLKGV